MKTIVKTLLATAALLTGTQAVAETVLETLPEHLLRRIQKDKFNNVTKSLIGFGQVSEGILRGAKLWPKNSAVKVCFFGGPKNVRTKIAAIASGWGQGDSPVKIDFGDPTNPRICNGKYAQIRVGYTFRGYWSLVGQDSITLSGQDEQSMNLARFDMVPPNDQEFQRVVLHEFGHALGFMHEHQDGTCESEFKWDEIYKYLAGNPNYWTREKVDFNMRTVPYYRGDVIGPFNSESIMLYSFPQSFYKGGAENKCYAPGNTQLSNGDLELLKTAYADQTQSFAALSIAGQSLSFADQITLENRLALYKLDADAQEAVIERIEAQQKIPNYLGAIESLSVE